MAKKDAIEVEGIHFIKILPGDRVLVALSPYGLGRGREKYRFK